MQAWAKKLLKRNKEVVGWIKIPGFTNSEGKEYINYPVLQHSDNDYYLTHNIDNQPYESGSIYADYVVPIDKNGQADNITIYGHHMRKLGKPAFIYYDKLLTELNAGLNDRYPKQLSLEDQGMFIVNYYQQKSELYTKKETKEKAAQADE